MRLGSLPGNFSFVKDNIFEPQLKVQPTAVVFFGACGAVSDGALDYAIASGAKYVMCRTCCHENIGGNVTVAARPNALNRFFRFKNRVYDRVRKTPKYAGFYFSPKYAPGAYPRSAAGGRLSSTDEIMAVARNSTDSDICRAIIDLDRYFKRWAKKPEVRDWICQDWKSSEERERRMRAIFGLPLCLLKPMLIFTNRPE
jgi:hypothetical protein